MNPNQADWVHRASHVHASSQGKGTQRSLSRLRGTSRGKRGIELLLPLEAGATGTKDET